MTSLQLAGLAELAETQRLTTSISIHLESPRIEVEEFNLPAFPHGAIPFLAASCPDTAGGAITDEISIKDERGATSQNLTSSTESTSPDSPPVSLPVAPPSKKKKRSSRGKKKAASGSDAITTSPQQEEHIVASGSNATVSPRECSTTLDICSTASLQAVGEQRVIAEEEQEVATTSPPEPSMLLDICSSPAALREAGTEEVRASSCDATPPPSPKIECTTLVSFSTASLLQETCDEARAEEEGQHVVVSHDYYVTTAPQRDDGTTLDICSTPTVREAGWEMRAEDGLEIDVASRDATTSQQTATATLDICSTPILQEVVDGVRAEEGGREITSSHIDDAAASPPPKASKTLINVCSPAAALQESGERVRAEKREIETASCDDPAPSPEIRAKVDICSSPAGRDAGDEARAEEEQNIPFHEATTSSLEASTTLDSCSSAALQEARKGVRASSCDATTSPPKSECTMLNSCSTLTLQESDSEVRAAGQEEIGVCRDDRATTTASPPPKKDSGITTPDKSGTPEAGSGMLTQDVMEKGQDIIAAAASTENPGIPAYEPMYIFTFTFEERE